MLRALEDRGIDAWIEPKQLLAPNIRWVMMFMMKITMNADRLRKMYEFNYTALQITRACALDVY